MKKQLTLLALTLVFTVQADWKQWRGPTGQGHADANLPLQWSETTNAVSYTHLRAHET